MLWGIICQFGDIQQIVWLEHISRILQLNTGKTDIFHDFHNKKGVPFSAYLTIENGIVIPEKTTLTEE